MVMAVITLHASARRVCVRERERDGERERERETDPTTNGGMQNGSSVETCTHCMHVFARLMPICMLSRRLETKFLRRTSVGSLLRVRCWLGKSSYSGLSHGNGAH